MNSKAPEEKRTVSTRHERVRVLRQFVRPQTDRRGLEAHSLRQPVHMLSPHCVYQTPRAAKFTPIQKACFIFQT